MNKHRLTIAALIVVFLIAWMFRYEYSYIGNYGGPIRVDRITGTVERYYSGGWNNMQD